VSLIEVPFISGDPDRPAAAGPERLARAGTDALARKRIITGVARVDAPSSRSAQDAACLSAAVSHEVCRLVRRGRRPVPARPGRLVGSTSSRP
jgi:hypothetical protein